MAPQPLRGSKTHQAPHVHPRAQKRDGGTVTVPVHHHDSLLRQDVLDAATRFLSYADLGPQGKMWGISKMFQDRDVVMLKSKKAVTTIRPRGVLSGFLAILPSLQTAVYVPPAGGRMPATLVRLRLSDEVWQQGAILSCYWDDGVLVLEDILQWGSKRSWASKSFEARWGEDMQAFCDAWMPDPVLAGHEIRLAEYSALDQLESQTPLPHQVVEFIWAEDVGMRRFIWVPDRSTNGTGASAECETGKQEGIQQQQQQQILLARREASTGPDIFSLWSLKGERLPQIGLVRTLAVSRVLRVHGEDEFYVSTTWNKMFERHEILGIASPPTKSVSPTE